MSIRDSIKEFFFGKEKTIGFSISSAGGDKKPVIKEGRGKVEKQTEKWPKEVGEEHPAKFEALEKIYKKVPIVTGGINKTVDMVVGPGFKIVSKNDKVRTTCEEFMQLTNFPTLLRRVVRDYLVYGNSFTEIVKLEEEIVNLKPLNPCHIYVKRDEYGKVLYYTQWFKNKPFQELTDEDKFQPEEMAHFKYNQIGDCAYGISIIIPLEVTLQNKLNMEHDMAVIFSRKANAPLHVKMGNDDFPASQADILSYGKKLQSLKNNQEWVTNHTIEMNVVGFEGKVLNMSPVMEYYENQMVYGLEVPLSLLGKGNMSEGLSRIQNLVYERRIISIQENIEKELEKKIFIPLCISKGVLKEGDLENYPEFEWGSLSIEQEEMEINKLLNILRSPVSPETKKEVETQLMKILGIPGEAPMPKEIPVGDPNDFKNPMQQKDKNKDFGGKRKPGHKDKKKDDYKGYDNESLEDLEKRSKQIIEDFKRNNFKMEGNK